MKYLFASLLICLSVSSNAQQNHFIYIQADNRQPFYIKLDKKILSSSVAGYLIIPKLQDGNYDLSIGFPKNEWPEQKVTCSVEKNDAGYLLKNFGEKGWGLFNLQTMGLLMAEIKTNTDSSKTIAKNDDAFSNALANVVNDPGIKTMEEPKEDSSATTPEVKKAPVKKVAKPVVKKDKPVANKDKEHIAKLLSRKNADGLKMVYIDKVNGSVDTINVVIPAEKFVVKVIPAKKVDTAAVVDKQAVAKHIPSNKKPVKKTAVTKPGIAKADNKIADKAKDSTALIFSEVKPAETKTGIVPENKNPVNSNDTANAVAPSKKIEDIIADIAKNNANTSEPVKDTVKVIQPEIKPEENKVDIAAEKKKEEPPVDTVAKTPVEITVDKPKEDNKIIVSPGDSTMNIIVLKQPEESKTDLVKEEKPAQKPADSTLAIVPEIKTEQPKPEPAKEPVIQPVDSSMTTSTEKVDVKKVETIVPDKKPADPLVVEKPKEDILPKTNSPASIARASCKYVADGDEFMSLRKKMSKGKSDNEMLFYAHQLFLKRCVTTKQVERLCLLFNNDLAKYNLFDDAYHYIADPDMFPTLQSQLTDEYYIKRFKAMLRQ